MAVQREALRRTREQLDAAQAGNLDALRQREDADVAKQKLQSLVEDQARLLGYLTGAELTGATSAQRARWRQIVKKLQDAHEKVERGGQSGLAGYAWASTLQANGFAWKELAVFLDESGLADEIAQAVAKQLLPPPGRLVVEGFILARDAVVAEMAQNISDQELGQLRDTYYQLRWAVSNNEEKVENLRDLLTGCPDVQKPDVQESPRPVPPQDAGSAAPPSAPPAPPATTPAKPAKNSHLTTSILIGGLAAAGAAAYLGKELGKLSDTGESGTSSGSSNPTLVSFTTFTCSGSSCSGTVTINFPSVMNSGSIIVVSTSGFMGQANVSSTSPPGRVTFTLVKTPYLTCYQTQRELAIWNGRSIDGPQTYAITGLSIPVSCQ